MTELGLPAYFFRQISTSALKRVLRAIATHITEKDGRFILQGEVADVSLAVDGGVLAVRSMQETHRIAASWDLLFDLEFL